MSVSVDASVIAQLQNALVAAMEEVDNLRSQMYVENGKIQREFRETVDLLLNNGKIDVSHLVNARAGSGSEGGYAAADGTTLSAMLRTKSVADDVAARLSALEATVTAFMGQRDSAPHSMDRVLQHTKSFLDRTDAEVDHIRSQMDEKMRWVDAKMAEMTTLAFQRDQKLQDQFDRLQVQHNAMMEEAVTSLKRREDAVNKAALSAVTGVGPNGTVAGSVPGFTVGADGSLQMPPELELRFAQLTKMAQHIDKRLNLMEENHSQLDGEQRELESSVQSLRTALQAERVRNLQPRPAVGDVQSETVTILTVRDEVLRQLENENATRSRQHKEDLMTIRNEVQRAITQTETNTNEISRVAVQFQALQQSNQRTEAALATFQERSEAEIRGHFSRAEQAQKTFFARQDQLLNNERHQLTVKLTTDLQRIQQKALEEHQQAEARRMEDIRSAHMQLRDDFNRFVTDQRADMEKTQATLRDYINMQTKEQADLLSKQFREVSDDTRRAMVNSMDDVKKLSTRTSEELKRIKAVVEENTQRLSEQHNYLHSRVQVVLDEEVKRFDRIAEDHRLRLGQQIDGEVQRAVNSTEGSLVRAYHNLKEEKERDMRLVREELEGIRGSLSAIAAPTATMAAFEARVDALRRDMTQLHMATTRLQELENKIHASVLYEVRKSVEGSKADVLRDVGVQLQRFDRSLNEVINETQTQFATVLSAVNNSHAQAITNHNHNQSSMNNNTTHNNTQPNISGVPPSINLNNTYPNSFGNFTAGGTGTTPTSSAVYNHNNNNNTRGGTSFRIPSSSGMNVNNNNNNNNNNSAIGRSGSYGNNGNYQSGGGAGSVSTPVRAISPDRGHINNDDYNNIPLHQSMQSGNGLLPDVTTPLSQHGGSMPRHYQSQSQQHSQPLSQHNSMRNGGSVQNYLAASRSSVGQQQQQQQQQLAEQQPFLAVSTPSGMRQPSSSQLQQSVRGASTSNMRAGSASAIDANNNNDNNNLLPPLETVDAESTDILGDVLEA